MLIHTPLGIGHPYRYEPDQRIPIYPIAGETWKVRARTDSDTENVLLHLRRGSITHVHRLHYLGVPSPDDHGPYGRTAKFKGKDTHLSEISTSVQGNNQEKEWEVGLPFLGENEEVIYWLENESGEHTDPFSVSALAWVPDAEEYIRQIGILPKGIALADKELLKDSSGNVFRVRFSLPLAAGDHVVGFGERFHSIDQRGEFVDAVVYEEYKGQGHRTYLPAPFGMVIGSDYGFYLKTANPSRYDVGVKVGNRIIVEVDMSENQSQLEIKAYGGSPTEMLHQYMSEFELPKVPPSWIYSLWGSSNEWNTQERVEAEIEASINHGIELGAIVIEAWSDESTFTVFRDAKFEPTDGSKGLGSVDISYTEDGAWPNPQQMIDDLHAKNIRILLWQIPVIKEEGSPGSQVNAMWNHAINKNLLIKDAEGNPYKVRVPWFRDSLLPDLTDEHVRKWWADLHRYLIEDMGVDGFKTDGGEHAWGANLHYLDGHSGLEKNNTLPVAYAQTFHELFASTKKQGITFSRSGFAGSSSYPTFWAGDEDSTWEALQATLRAGITASASGLFFWGWDIGGFSGDLPTSELYLRGTAVATFCPIMQFHSEFNHHAIPSNDRTPWNIAERTSDSRVIPVFRKFVEVRKLLIPYLEREGAKAISLGRPLMAGLFFDYANDPDIWNVPYQYMLGRYLLVAPIIEADVATQRVYLPEGAWIDFWDHKLRDGGESIEVESPIDQIPVFIRADSPKWVLELFQS